jgi:hypothetical protein
MICAVAVLRWGSCTRRVERIGALRGCELISTVTGSGSRSEAASEAPHPASPASGQHTTQNLKGIEDLPAERILP